MNPRLRALRSTAGLLVIAWLLAACATAGAPADGQRVGAPAAAPPQPAASAAPSLASEDGSSGSIGGNGSNGGGNGAFKDDAKIVRTGSLSLQVTDLDVAVRTGRDAIRGLGGYIGASRETHDGDASVASVTYRIPSDRWEEALDALHKLGKKLAEETDAVEVTGQLVDLAARIDNLRASERALQAIAARATKISDVLEVENRLSEIRGQIEQLDAQRAHLSDQAGFGTLTVTYGLQVVAVTEAAKGWDAGQEVDRATASLIDIIQAVTSAGIWFGIVWLPVLIALGIIVAAMTFLLRRLGLLGRPEAVDAPPVAGGG